MKLYLEPLLLILAIVAGSLTGMFFPFETSLADFFIISMLFFLFYNISFDKFLKGAKNKKYLSVAWVSNFILIPTLAFTIVSIFVDNSNAIFIGLIIYLVAPCTDWYLGFTKLARGDVEINSALLPLNLLSQIVLLPVYLYVFTDSAISIPFDSFFDVMIFWVLLPFVVAQLLRFLVATFSKRFMAKIDSVAESGMHLSLIFLVFSIFNTNIDSLIYNVYFLPIIFIVIFIFIVITYFLMRFISRKFVFSKKEEVSLTITAVARNAPLMLAISLGFFPQETAIHLVLVIGMLAEVPLLITITYLLKKNSGEVN
jgi:ACR3 family arsenite efflux pump ArsB